MDAKFAHILGMFRLEGTPVSCERYGFGHINETYLVLTGPGPRYILQRINDHVFPKCPSCSTISPRSPPICGNRPPSGTRS